MRAAILAAFGAMAALPMECTSCSHREGDPCSATNPCHAGLVCERRACVPCSASMAKECHDDSDTRCQATDACKAMGACSVRAGTCEATSDKDCRASIWCRSAGACSLVGDRCAAASDADCASSEACKTLGACKRDNGGDCLPEPDASTHHL